MRNEAASDLFWLTWFKNEVADVQTSLLQKN